MVWVLGFGGYVPQRIVTNDDWATRLDTSDEWITTRTGIKRRRFADETESTMHLAAAAAEVAIAGAGLTPQDIDEIILATDTPEMLTPDTASFVQHRLGCREVPAYDLGGSGCAGFVTGMDVARARIHLRRSRILVIGVEIISRLISLEERSTAVLFGDGAGAVVMGPAPDARGPAPVGAPPAQLLTALSGTDGSQGDVLNFRVGGSRHPFRPERIADGSYLHLHMDGRGVFREAVKRMSETIEVLLAELGCTVRDVALVIPHQANRRIIDAVGRRVGLSEQQVFVNVDEYGNTGSASVPFALWEAVKSGAVSEGDLVILTAFGAGFHWAGAALQF